MLFITYTHFCLFSIFTNCIRGFPGSSDSKESACKVEDPLHYSCLENSMDRRSLAGHSPQGHRVEHNRATNTHKYTHTHTHTHTRRQGTCLQAKTPTVPFSSPNFKFLLNLKKKKNPTHFYSEIMKYLLKYGRN